MVGAAAGPLILCLDTGSPLVSVALGCGPEGKGATQGAGGEGVAAVLASARLLAARARPMERSSSQLLSLVAEVLAEGGARPADLGGVVALAGPGSFTGLRIGLATALGLHQALGLPALALPTLQVLAAEAAPGAGRVIAAVDALRGEWSVQSFSRTSPAVPHGEMELVAAAALTALLPGEEERVVIGFGVTRLAAATAPPAGAGLRLVEPGPLAAGALRLAASTPAAQWRAELLAAPIYSRPPAVTLPSRPSPPAGRAT